MKFHRLAAIFAACALAFCMTGCSNQQSASAPDSVETSAESGSSSESVPLDYTVSTPDIGSDLTIGVGQITAHAGDKAVPVSVQIWNNPGYAVCGIQLYYDSKLKPVTEQTDNQFTDLAGGKSDLGNAANGFMKSCLVNEDEHMIAFGGMSGENSMEDGTIFTVYFDIPEDAPAGQSFSLVTAIDSFNNLDKTPLNPKTVEGAIVIG